MKVVSLTGLLQLAVAPALAVCLPAAPAPALDAFNTDPAGWIASNGRASDLGTVSLAIAAAAVNAGDPKFGKALSAMLGAASSDQGRIIGHALSGLEGSCSDPKDPADVADKKYISLNILPNLLSNLSANVAYGQGTGPETTSTGGGGGGGGGNALVGAGLPEGGSNAGSEPNDTTATPTSGDPVAELSAGAIGASTATTSGPSFNTGILLATPATITTTPGGTASGSVSANQ